MPRCGECGLRDNLTFKWGRWLCQTCISILEAKRLGKGLAEGQNEVLL